MIICSLHQTCTNKDTKAILHHKWLPEKMASADFVRSVCVLGKAYTNIHTGNVRKRENFAGASICSLDFDTGQQLPDIVSDPWITANAMLLYTSPSHTKAKHKFRVVFQHPYITDGDMYETLIAGLRGLYSATDAAPTSRSSIFYGNTRAKVKFWDNALSREQVKALLEIGKDLYSPKAQFNSEPYEIRVGDGTSEFGKSVITRTVKRIIECCDAKNRGENVSRFEVIRSAVCGAATYIPTNHIKESHLLEAVIDACRTYGAIGPQGSNNIESKLSSFVTFGKKNPRSPLRMHTGELSW